MLALGQKANSATAANKIQDGAILGQNLTKLEFKEFDEDSNSSFFSQDKSTKGSATSPDIGSGMNAETAFFAFNQEVEQPAQKNPDAVDEEQKKEHPLAVRQQASGGAFKVSLGFYDLNADFVLPSDFKLIKKLGKGAYGRVMQILHSGSQREYACKRYEHVFSDEQRSRRLLREMNILKQMKHPCCNKLLAVISPSNVQGQKDIPLEDLKFNEVYLVLRKCDMDLRKLIKSGKHLEETQVKSIVYDILCGLNYLHKAKIIHRDLKPGNILVNNDCTIQICDFGLARSMDGIYRSEVLDTENSGADLSMADADSPMKDDENLRTPKVNTRLNQIQATRVALDAQQANFSSDAKDVVSVFRSDTGGEKLLSAKTKDLFLLDNKPSKKKVGFNITDAAATITVGKAESIEQGSKKKCLLKQNTMPIPLQRSGTKMMKRMKLSKELTQHVVTRWYRAPEVILMNEFYSYSIDIWSVGCIFAELLSMMVENFPDPFSRVPLFPGKSCYPLSPGMAAKSQEQREKDDQMNIIFGVIGTPDREEPLEEFLEQQSSVDYVRKLNGRPRVDLAEKYPATESRGITLLQKMLEFNPGKRPTAEEALQDPYFDDIRLPEQERFEVAEIHMPVDDEGCSNMPMNELKRMVIEEITKLDSDKFDFSDDYEEECEDY